MGLAQNKKVASERKQGLVCGKLTAYQLVTTKLGYYTVLWILHELALCVDFEYSTALYKFRIRGDQIYPRAWTYLEAVTVDLLLAKYTQSRKILSVRNRSVIMDICISFPFSLLGVLEYILTATVSIILLAQIQRVVAYNFRWLQCFMQKNSNLASFMQY